MNKQMVALVLIFLGILGWVAFDRFSAPKVVNIDQTPSPSQEECDRETTTEDCRPISLDTSTWKVFENPEYGYTISYPVEGQAVPASDYGSLESINFGIPERFTLGGVDATIYPNSSFLGEGGDANRLDLESYAEAIRMLQVSSPNPNFKDQHVGELEEAMLNGRKAYQFTLDQGFTMDTQGRFGYTLPKTKTYRYVITENPQGQKLIIYYYQGNPIAEAMFKTFRFK